MNLSYVLGELKRAIQSDAPVNTVVSTEDVAEYVGDFELAEFNEIAFYCGYLLGAAQAVGMTVGELLDNED